MKHKHYDMIGLTPKDNELRMQVGFTLTHEANHQLIASDKDGNWKCPMEPLGELLELVRQDEREACELLVEKMQKNLGAYKAHEDSHDDGWQDACCEIQSAIRARGEK